VPEDEIVVRAVASKLEAWNPTASAFIGVFLVVAHAGMGFYSAHRLQLPPFFSLLYYFTLAGLITYWVHCDRLRRQERSVLDQGLFFYFTWPVALPWYLVASRGFARGLAAFGLFLLAFICAYGISVAVFLLAGGAR
jgi:hypothetical protein